jgi:hypothetical protein
MIVNVIVHYEWAIPRTAELVGVPEEEIRKGFEEAHKFGKPYVFTVDIPEKVYYQAEGFDKGGDHNGP